MLDAHVHYWDPGRFDYPWLRPHPRLARAFLPGDLLTHLGAAPRVAGVLVVQADCRWDQAEAEVAWVEELAATAPPIRGMVAAAPLERGRACAELLAALARRPLVVGVRRLLEGEAAGFARSPEFVQGTRLLAGHELVSDLCIRHDQFAEVIELVRRCPDVSFVLDHLGKPDIAAGRFRPWADDLATLAAFPNVHAKLSGLTREAGPHWRPETVLPYLSHALETFTPRRCLFGSDWPVVTLHATYAQWVDVVAEALDGLTPQDQADVLGGTAGRLYRLADPITA